MFTWQNKPLFLDHKRNVDSEMIENNIDMDDIIECLDLGQEVKKRKRGIIEKWNRVGGSVIIAAIEDCGDYWLVRHVGRITATKKKLRIIRGD